MTDNKKIGIVGSGLIGRSWAMIFAAANYDVYIYDIDPIQVEKALVDIKEKLQTLEKDGQLRGTKNVLEQVAAIKGTTSLKEAVKDAFYIQECVPEVLEIKRNAMKQIDEVVSPYTIIASSTTAFLPSLFTDHLKNRKNVIVAHPVNPPYYVPLVEVVPAPWTDPEVSKKTRAIMEEIGQTPVSLSREIPGFAVNRLQYALLNEAVNLVKDGILDVQDIDKVMSEGLGMRYAFLGVIETTHLNAEGFSSYCERYGNAIHTITEDFKTPPRYEGQLVKNIEKQLTKEIPIEKLQEKRNWRDACLMKLSLLKKQMKK